MLGEQEVALIEKRKNPSENISGFLNFVDACTQEYRWACDGMEEEDKRPQDLLHEMEFAGDRAGRNRVATRLQTSRKQRRRMKDLMKRDEQVVKFFEDPENRKILNKMRQLLGRQRKEEEYLEGERTYKPRAK